MVVTPAYHNGSTQVMRRTLHYAIIITAITLLMDSHGGYGDAMLSAISRMVTCFTPRGAIITAVTGEGASAPAVSVTDATHHHNIGHWMALALSLRENWLLPSFHGNITGVTRRAETYATSRLAVMNTSIYTATFGRDNIMNTNGIAGCYGIMTIRQ